jgi:hypothetical protein
MCCMTATRGGGIVGRRSTVGLLAITLLVAMILTGCGGAEVTFVSEDGAYTLEQLEELHAAQTPPSSIKGRPVEDSSELRREALVDLRSRGGEAAELAEFVTQTLADTGRSVPYYGEAASFDGTPSWILLEAWGVEGGALEATRLWVFDRDTGAIVYSSTNR